MNSEVLESFINIISQVIQINEKYDAISKLNGESFNIFSILNMERKEVETHSKFIYELLNPNGTHNQGDLFLSLFISNTLGLKNSNKIRHVAREDLTAFNRRIDFTIETEAYQIGIEMKIDANDQYGQLLDYSKELKNRCHTNQKAKLYYLTLSAYEAKELSTGGELKVGHDYTLLSFEYDILNWIDKCIEKSATIPTLREGLVHYKNLIRKITNKLPNMMEDEMEEIIRGSKDIKAIHTIVNDYPRLWAKKEMEFWDRVWDKLIEKEKNYNFKLIDYYDIWTDEEGNDYDKNTIINNIIEKRNKKNEVVGFVLKTRYTRLEIIEFDSTISFYVAFFNESNKSVMNNSLEAISQTMNFNGKNKTERYKYFEEQITFYGRYQPEPTYDLFDTNAFENYVNKVTNKTIEYIKFLYNHEKQIEQAVTN